MATISLLLPAKTLPTLRPSKLRIRAQSHPSKELRLSWRHELKRANLATTVLDDNDEQFQGAVDRRAVDNVRMLVVDAVQHAKAGHPGMALGMAEVGYVLYRQVLRYNPRNPRWFNRDRFVLSAGHGCLLQYVCLHLAGFQSVQYLQQMVIKAKSCAVECRQETRAAA